MQQNNILISVKNLTKTYGKGNLAARVLDLKHLEIMEGDFISVTGPSGCGKSTLLNLLSALDRPSGGDIFFRGENIVGLNETALCKYRKAKIGFVFQSHHLIPSLNALKNVLLPALTTGNGFPGRARELLGMVGLAGKERRLPGQLSGGEQQRVAIARSLIMDPDLILADEPTGNLDTASGEIILDLFKRLNRLGKTMIMATHDPQVAGACGRIIRLRDGRIVSDSRL
ncbi:MAG: ABC transporter ATP-binding protein [Peptococcaceae bacterium BRH_c4a]|nr:MAG: ABC transporter ATP-binding protein [Peptococcaceae bacterium BRH_c4a]